MYLDFFNFKEIPFNITADPYFFFSSKSHTEALSNLLYGIEQRKGIIVITGEVGTGKTMLCRKLLQLLDKKTQCALVLNTHYTELELLQTIASDFGISAKNHTKIALIDKLNKFLIKQTKKGNNVVILIDEAQNLSVNQLEQIRLLSNLETEKNKLLQIVLIGQPELDKKLHLYELRQLRQRIGVYFHIQPLEKKDLSQYIYHRLNKVCQHELTLQKIFFTDEAIEALYQHTQGAPRMINILCDRALLAVFVKETYRIDHHIIENCVKEVLHYEHNL